MNVTTIAVACRNASGSPDLPIFRVPVTPREICQGLHYDKAEIQARNAGYEGPFLCYDADEYGVILSAAKTLEQLSRTD